MLTVLSLLTCEATTQIRTCIQKNKIMESVHPCFAEQSEQISSRQPSEPLSLIPVTSQTSTPEAIETNPMYKSEAFFVYVLPSFLAAKTTRDAS